MSILIRSKSLSNQLYRVILITSMLCCQHQKSAFAQINSDNTLPNNSQVNQHKNIYNITGGTQAGNNLFHSFEKFSIPNNHEVYFDNAIKIQNIINRVTGKSISEINGLIRANGKANFFLINPNGIVFGENSRLDIGGSFIGSTADSYKFSDGKEFSAIYPEEKPLLSINVPLGLQYGKNQSANIVNSGNLTVNNGSNITLIGNSLENTGKLATSSGQISLAAIDRQGFARLGKFGELLSIESQPVDGIDGYENNSGIVLNSGTINSFASTKKNNKIQILGNRVGLLENSLLDVSGNTGGGEIIIGNHNTLATYIDSKAFLKADAVNTGDGGSINVSATKSTRAYGTFSAKGGLDNGNGGLIDISGNHFLDVKDINIDTAANNGFNGNWLLKSNNILLVSQGYFRNAESDKFDIFQPSKGGTVLDAYTIEKQLSSGNNITIAADSTNSELGNIKADRVYIEPTNNSPITLTFQAANDISFSKGYIQPISNRLGVVLQADTNGSGKGNISLGNGIPYSFKINTRGEGFSASAISILLSGAEIMSSFSNVNDSKSIVLGAENSSGSQNKDIINQEKLKHEISGIDISAKNDILMQQSGIIKETDSAANSGDININADSFYIQVGGIENNTSGSGNAGDINFKVNLFSVKSGGTNSFTEGNGNSGSVNIETDILDLNTGRIQSLTKSFGHAGNIVVKANSVSLQNGGFITTTEGDGNAGKIIVNSVDKILIGEKGVLNGNSDSNGRGNAGEITIDTASLVLNNGTIGSNTKSSNTKVSHPQVSSSQGNAGEISINADSILLQNNSTIASTTSNQQDAGKIRLQADNITLRNSSNIVTKSSKEAVGNAGQIIVEADSILFENEAEFINLRPGKISSLSSNTEGKGNAGTIDIRADKIILRNQAGIGIGSESEGDAGKLTIDTSLLALYNSRAQNNSGIDSSSEGSGKAGELTITADRILLDNSDVQAQTESGNGGNINFNLKEFLLLRNQSRISTTAGILGKGGNGGNINIDALGGFVVALPNENSDITANAFEGKGGNIKTATSGIFGIQLREEPNQQTSDITASSELGIDGTVEINSPDINPSGELVELPSVPIQTKLAQGCYSPGYAENKFFIVGRGGLPNLPEDFLTPSSVRVNWINPQQNSENRGSMNRVIKFDVNSAITEKPRQIVEATGWIQNEKGEIIFTANPPLATANNVIKQARNCDFSAR